MEEFEWWIYRLGGEREMSGGGSGERERERGGRLSGGGGGNGMEDLRWWTILIWKGMDKG